MQNDTHLLIAFCREALQIKLPVDITLKTKAKKTERDLAGYCDSRFRRGKLVRHVIVINLDVSGESGFNIHDTIAHELIHAAQIEHGVINENYFHDEKFQAVASILAENLREMGFNIGELYSSETDTD